MIQFVLTYNLLFLFLYCFVGFFNRDMIDNLVIDIVVGPRITNKIFFILLSPFLLVRLLVYLLFEGDIFLLINYINSEDEDDDEDKNGKDK